jgi:membrane protein
MMSTDTAAAKQSKSLWKLGGLSLSQLGRDVLDDIITNNVFDKAAELAFYFLFALFPLILIMMTLFGLFASDNVELQSKLLSHFSEFLPPAAFHLLRTVAGELAAHASGGKLTFGIIFALWGVSGGISAMISSLNLAHRIRETRPWLKVRLITLGLSLLISILLLVALFIGLAATHFVHQFGIGLRLHLMADLVWKAVQWSAAIVFVTGSCSLIYYCGPNWSTRGRWQWVTPGSMFGTFIWLVALLGFRIYLEFFNNYSTSYGSLGAVMMLLAWLYLTSLAYLIGGYINAAIARAGEQGL